MSQYYDLNNTGPQVQDRLDQTQENKQDIATLEGKVTAIENEIGESGQGGNTINARLDALETAVGSGGSVDERIAAAETEIIGGASSDYNTLGKVEGELEDTYRKNETYSKTELDNLITTPNVLYVTVIATSGTTDVTTLLPATGAADTVYRVGNWNGTQYDTTMYALYAWNGTAYICLAVRSFVGEVYDISVNHPDGQGTPTPYADLAAALGTSGANIPADIRRGGMSIKFIQGTVQSSDNKYVQFRCKTQLFSINPEDWAFEGNDTLVDNPEFVYVKADAEDKILYGVKKDGEFYFGAGCPLQVQKYVLQQLNKYGVTVEELLTTKVDKVIGKSLIDEDFASSQSVVENNEWLQVTTDSEGRILEGIRKDGSKYVAIPDDINSELKKETVDLDSIANVGYYIGGVGTKNSWGNPLSTTNVYAYADIPMKVGDVVTYTCMAPQGVAVMAILVSGNIHDVIEVGSGSLKTYIFKCTFDCTLTVSWNNNYTHKLEIASSQDYILDAEEYNQKKQNKRNFFDGGFLNIAYSVMGGNDLINSYEHFLYAIKNGFKSLKADVALTSDDELVCWHGNVNVLENGKIEDINSGGNKVRSYTLAQMLDFEYNANENVIGYYPHVCEFEKFLFLCKMNGIIPFVTIRNNAFYAADNEDATAIVLDKLFELLRKYDLESTTIINVYPGFWNNVEFIRLYNKSIYICNTFDTLTTADVERAKMYDNIILGYLYDYQSGSIVGINAAKNANIPVFSADLNSYPKYIDCISKGVDGAQMPAPVLDYSNDVITFKVTLSEGVATFGSNKFTANAEYSSGTIRISEIKRIGNNGNTLDGVVPLIMNTMPYVINCKKWSTPVDVYWYNNAIEISTSEDASYIVTILV